MYRPVYKPWPCDFPGPWAGVWLESVGHRHCTHPSVVPSPNFYCAHVLTRGRMQYSSGKDFEVRLVPGDMFAMWPGVGVGFHPERPWRGDQIRMEWIRIFGPLAHAYMEALGFTEARPVFRAARPGRVRTLMKDLLTLAEEYPADADVRATGLLHLMAAACGYSSSRRRPAGSLASKVKAAMERELHQGMNVEQFSRAFGVSRATLFLHFRKEFGESPVEVLIGARIARAKVLLEGTDLPVGSIASACGYSDPLYFSRQFRGRTGFSPGGYRQRRRGRKRG